MPAATDLQDSVKGTCRRIAPGTSFQADMTQPHSRAPIQTLNPGAEVFLYRSLRLRYLRKSAPSRRRRAADGGLLSPSCRQFP